MISAEDVERQASSIAGYWMERAVYPCRRCAVPRQAENGKATMWLAVTAFGRQTGALARHQKGDLISVSGALQVSQWSGTDGGTQSGYALVADSVISARTVRPGGKKGQRGQAGDALHMTTGLAE